MSKVPGYLHHDGGEAGAHKLVGLLFDLRDPVEVLGR